MTEQDIDTQIDAPGLQFGEGQSKAGDIKSIRLHTISTADDTVNVTEPSTPTYSVYPYNRVDVSLSGHVKEIDDTPCAERIFEMHKSGTFYEIHPNGTKVTKIFGDDFDITLGNGVLFIGGDRHVVIQGDATLLVAGNMKQKISGNLETVVHGDMTTRVSGKTTLYSKDDFQIETNNNINMLSNQKTQIRAKSDIAIQTDSNFALKTLGQSKFYSVSKTYINASGLYQNSTTTIPNTVTIKSKDIGAGLNVSESVCEPNVETLMAVRTDNSMILNGIETTTYPKDRISKE
jgi:hypothetical protein